METRAFLDTNIFVYSFDGNDAKKQRRAQDLIEEAMQSRNAVISYQVVQEFLNVALRRFRKVLPPSEARIYVERILLPICEIYPDARLYSDALSLAEETGWGFYDSLIVGSALLSRCAILYTEDLQHGRRVRGIQIRNPFAPAHPE